MAGSVNKVIIIGHLGADPSLKFLPSGQAVCEMRIATSEKFKGKNDQLQERTEWHTVVAWGKTAENCGEYLKKGRAAYVEGKLQTRSWEDKQSGEKRYKTEIRADFVVFLGGGGQGDGQADRGGGPDRGQDRGGWRGARQPAEEHSGGYGGAEDFGGDPGAGGDDDIPF